MHEPQVEGEVTANCGCAFSPRHFKSLHIFPEKSDQRLLAGNIETIYFCTCYNVCCQQFF